MSASTRETAIIALVAALAAALPDMTVERRDDFADDLGTANLVTVEDGDPGEADVALSPLSYAYAHEVPVNVTVVGDPAMLPATLDAVLVTIGAALEADRTLGGTVDYLEPQAPVIEAFAGEGTPGARQAVVTITLYYTTPSPLA
jgi:hypothetical protein